MVGPGGDNVGSVDDLEGGGEAGPSAGNLILFEVQDSLSDDYLGRLVKVLPKTDLKHGRIITDSDKRRPNRGGEWDEKGTCCVIL